jgi:hypothetical protein
MTWTASVVAMSNTRTISYVEVLHIKFGMLGQVVVLLSHEHTFLKDVLVDLLAIRFWDKHCRELLALFVKSRTMRRCSGCVEVGVEMVEGKGEKLIDGTRVGWTYCVPRF